MSEKLCLKWNDLQENVNSAFGSLREDNEFADVTLACEDGEQMDAHKVILAASSPFFQNLLKRTKHPHPLIYMRGVKSENLLAVVDFLYRGEASVGQENLDSFLAIAEELQLKGLMGQDSSGDNSKEKEKRLPRRTEPTFKRESKTSNSNIDISNQNDQMAANEFSKANRSVALTSPVSEDFQELNEKVKSMLEKTQSVTANGKKPLYVCKACGKQGECMNVQRHIEANHLEGVSIPCNLCEKTSRSRNGLMKHKKKDHADYQL